MNCKMHLKSKDFTENGWLSFSLLIQLNIWKTFQILNCKDVDFLKVITAASKSNSGTIAHVIEVSKHLQFEVFFIFIRNNFNFSNTRCVQKESDLFFMCAQMK